MARPAGRVSAAALPSGSDAFLSRLRARHRATLARAISLVEQQTEAGATLLSRLRPHQGQAWRIGITGPPGAGKSTLVSALVQRLLADGSSAGVLAVDPTSPFSHGAVLGDRLRMAEVDNGDRVFIRSFASRGESGGLSAAVTGAADVLDAAGFNHVLIESVGVGQVELDIRDAADVTVVVLVPESGDEVQAIKAGLMEIADVYIVNKSDRPGAGAVADQVRATVRGAAPSTPGWRPPVLCASAATKQGIAEIAGALRSHREWVGSQGLVSARRAARLRRHLGRMVERAAIAALWDGDRAETLEQAAAEVQAGTLSLEDAVRRLLPAGQKR